MKVTKKTLVGRELFMNLAETIFNNPTEKLWCDGDIVLTSDENVSNAIQLIFDSLGIGDAIVKGRNSSGNYYIELN
jgi:hypothetical protein